MKKLFIIIMILIMSLVMSGCGEAPKPTLSPEGVEHIITENIITETILYEDVTTTWD